MNVDINLILRVNEIEDLRREVSEQARELERIESERNQARADRIRIVRSVASLESDLQRVISDAEISGKDLKDLKIERDRSETGHRDEMGMADRAQRQLCSQLGLAIEQLESQREKTKKAIAEWDGHVCQPHVPSSARLIQVADSDAEMRTSMSCVRSTRTSARDLWYRSVT